MQAGYLEIKILHNSTFTIYFKLWWVPNLKDVFIKSFDALKRGVAIFWRSKYFYFANAFSELSQISKMEFFVKIVNGLKRKNAF